MSRLCKNADMAFVVFACVVVCNAALAGESVSPAQTDADLSAEIECAALEEQDFTDIPDAPTAIISARMTSAQGGFEAYCAVIGVVAPQVQFELRMPVQGWNGRYFQTGCWGLCGNVPIHYCDDAQRRGFAVAAQNMGHVGHFWRDPLWASVPALRKDFGWRSTHVVALAAKEIVARYYGVKPAYAYFRGCSTGGREGLSEAQHFPGDFDGVIAGNLAFPGRLGAIANNWDAHHLLDDEGRPVFSSTHLEFLAGAVMRACDDLDGLEDGIIDDPRVCSFDPASIACTDMSADGDCLNAAQIAAAKRLYDGARNSFGVALVPGGAPYGSELEWNGPGRRAIAQSWLRFFAFGEIRPDYDYRDFDFDADIGATEASAAMFDPVAPKRAPDLTEYEQRGGKLIIYHGWADPGVSPLGTLDYYAHIAARQGGLERVRNWFRVFMAPGMYHCGGGDAPNSFDLLSPMVRWVEAGEAPDGVIAAQMENGEVVRTRPLFAYPYVARYSGSGNVNDAENWRRSSPPHRFDDRRDWIWAPKD